MTVMLTCSNPRQSFVVPGVVETKVGGSDLLSDGSVLTYISLDNSGVASGNTVVLDVEPLAGVPSQAVLSVTVSLVMSLTDPNYPSADLTGNFFTESGQTLTWFQTTLLADGVTRTTTIYLSGASIPFTMSDLGAVLIDGAEFTLTLSSPGSTTVWTIYEASVEVGTQDEIVTGVVNRENQRFW